LLRQEPDNDWAKRGRNPDFRPIRWQLATNDQRIEAAPGSTFNIRLQCAIEPGYFTWSTEHPHSTHEAMVPRTIAVVDKNACADSGGNADVSPSPVVEHDETFSADVAKLQGGSDYLITVPVRVHFDAPPGETPLTVKVIFQPRDNRYCYNQESRTFTVTLRVK
jgi:hypothetical protein